MKRMVLILGVTLTCTGCSILPPSLTGLFEYDDRGDSGKIYDDAKKTADHIKVPNYYSVRDVEKRYQVGQIYTLESLKPADK